MYMFTLNIIIVCYEDPQKSSDILNKPQYHAWRGHDRLPVSPHTLHIIVDEHGSRSYSGYWQPERIPQPYIYSCVPCISTIPTRPSRLISLSTMGGGGTILLSTHSVDPCMWGESDHPAFGPPSSLSLHLASSSITPAGSVYKSRGDSVVRMRVQLKRWCVSCVWLLQGGIVVIWRRLCVSMI